MTNKQLSCEGYKFKGPITTGNGKGELMDVYKVRRVEDAADLLLTFSRTSFKDRHLQVCKVIPSDGWMHGEYNGCTFMAANETADDPSTAEHLDPRQWSILWLRDDIPPMVYWPGSFQADKDAEREVVWALLLEQIEAGIRRIERSQRDLAGEDTGVMLSEWARNLNLADLPTPEGAGTCLPQAEEEGDPTERRNA